MTMRNLLITVLIAATGAAAAQQPPANTPRATGTGVISGRVIEAGSNKPVPDATVWLHQTRGDIVNARSEQLKTDSSGAFEFHTLPVGQFSILVHADEYEPGAFGKRRPEGEEAWIPLKAGQTFSDATIEMFRGGTISGVVTNDRGEPMKEVHVGTWHRTSSGELKHRHGGSTDARGAYRMTAVPAGDHFVVAHVWHDTMRQGPSTGAASPCTEFVVVPPPPGTPNQLPIEAPIAKPKHKVGEWFVTLPRWIPEPAPDDRGQPRTIPTVIYPGVTELLLASVVSVRSGEDRAGIDLRFQAMPSTSVQGRVVPLPGRKIGKGSEVRLRLPGAPPDAFEHRTWIQPDHTFRFLAVLPGEYVLEVQLQESVSCDVIVRSTEDVPTEMPLDVPPTGLEDVVVHMTSGVTMQGRIRFDGKAPRPEAMDIWLQPVLGGDSQPGDWDDDELIMMGGLRPGSYALSVSQNGDPEWSVRSMTLGRLDLVTRPVLINREDVEGIEVVMTDRPSPLDGGIVDANGKPVRDATVVVYPVDRASWSTAHDSLDGFERTRSIDGTYRFEHLVPGDYFVAAVEERRMGSWPHAAFLEASATRALRVRIAPGERRTLRLTLQAR